MIGKINALMLISSLLISSLFISGTVSGATWYVPDDFSTIQGALNGAANGDTIIVRAGHYTERIDFLGKAVTLMSEEGPAATTIDGAGLGSVVTFQSGEAASTVLTGFTITGGQASNGGGITCIGSSPTITKNVITGNFATVIGAGIYCEDSSPTISGNDILGNNSDDRGGGIGCELNSTPAITGNRIEENWAEYSGGGINCDHGATPLIADNLFCGNTTEAFGAAILSDEASPVILSNRFFGNIALQSGGAVYMHESDCRIDNNLVAGNEAILFGGGIIIDGPSTASLSNNTIVENLAGVIGGGLHLWDASVTTVANTILWNNSAKQGPQISLMLWTKPPTLNISNSNVEGGQSSVHVESNSTLNWGLGMIESKPLFVDSDNGDFHLTFNSPCRASGDNSAVTELTDFEGDPRIAYGTVDMGADEFYTHLYYTGDATPGGTVELKFIDLPGASPVGLWIAFNALDTPIPGAYGDWWLLPPMVGPYSLPPIPGNGVYVLPGTIPASPPGPYTLYLQAIMGAPLKLTNLCTIHMQ